MIGSISNNIHIFVSNSIYVHIVIHSYIIYNISYFPSEILDFWTELPYHQHQKYYIMFRSILKMWPIFYVFSLFVYTAKSRHKTCHIFAKSFVRSFFYGNVIRNIHKFIQMFSNNKAKFARFPKKWKNYL